MSEPKQNVEDAVNRVLALTSRLKSRIAQQPRPIVDTILKRFDNGQRPAQQQEKTENAELLQAVEELKKKVEQTERENIQLKQDLDEQKKRGFSVRLG